MRRPCPTPSPLRRWHNAFAPAVLWLMVLSLSLLGPLACIIHCVEMQRAASGAPTRALFTCQLFDDNAPRGRAGAAAGQHTSTPILPESPFSLLRAYYTLLLPHQRDAVAPLLLLAFLAARNLPLRARLADAPPTPPPRLAAR